MFSTTIKPAKNWSASDVINHNTLSCELALMGDEQFALLIRAHSALGDKLRESLQMQSREFYPISGTPLGRKPPVFLNRLERGDCSFQVLTPRATYIIKKYNLIGSGYKPIGYEEALKLSKQWWRWVNIRAWFEGL